LQFAKVSQLFLLFSGLQHACEYEDLIRGAMMQVQASMRCGADADDIRLSYLAAAAANLRYRQILAARAANQPAYAGDTAAHRSDSASCSLAQQLVTEYTAAAADLLRDDSFVFRTVGCRREGCV